TFKTYTEKDGLPHFRLRAMIQDHEGNTWFGTTEGLSRYDGQSFTTYTKKDGLPHDQIQTLQQDNQGNVWVSTLEGLCRFDGKTWISFSDQDNLVPRLVYTIFQDEDSNLWFGTQNGVWRYDGKVFQNMLEQDGLSGNAVSAIFQDRDGTLWFGTNKGVSRFDQPTPVSPSVVIESIIADRRHQAEDNVVIPDSTSLFVIEYHGISFKTRPGGLVFRYRLKGYDQQWYTTRAVKIEYQDLPRGNYIFQIQAVDRDLAYSDIQTLTFMIEPDPQVEALTQALNQAGSAGKFIGESSALKHIQEQLGSVAVTNLTVLIFGETGTGKGVAARTLHSLSPRKAGPFVQINCGAIPEGLVESELFGHEKGAFTGAVSRKLGKIELAKGGTLFLDEIGDLALDAQVKLLHLLEEGIFERVGDTASLEADVRVVAATNRDLEKMVAEGRFREDLFFRLQVFPVRLPPLRERQEDILQLAMYFLQRMAAHLNKAVTGFTSEALSTLNSYGWPGNVRELEHAVQRAVIVCPGPVIRAEDFAVGSAGEESPVSGPFLSLEEVERRHIHEALEQTGWTIKGPAGAAKLLGLHPSTLRHRMKKLGLIRS
ncbi:MAG: sigma 54-interacting transcriptional regulator, partial [bacterium]|nr:sigma 54-interacting transcriptional regulator [bacterium]